MTSQTKPVSKQLKLTFDQINACANWPNVLNYIRNFDFSDTPELELDQDKILLNIKYLLLQRFYNISDQELLNLITDRISFQYFLDFQEECFLDEDPQYIKFRQVLASNNVLEKVMDIISHNLSKHGLCISQGTISDIKLEPVSSHTQRPDLSKPKIASSGNRSGITLEDIKLMIQGQSSQSFKHYALQMQLHQAQKDVRNGNISIETAAQSLFELCQKVLRGNGKTAAKAQPSSSGTKINLETLKQMILGEKKLQFKHYALQMQLHQAQKDVRNGTVSLDIAAKNLFELCKRILAGKSRATSSPQSSEGSKISLETIKEMIQGQSSQSFKHYALQMQLHQAQKDVRNGDTSLESAANNLLGLCKKVLTRQPKSQPETPKKSSGSTGFSRELIKDMIMGQTRQQFKHYALQMQLHQAQKDVRHGAVSIEEAMETLLKLARRIISEDKSVSSPATSSASKRQLPDKSRNEWRQIILGEIDYDFKNYVLQVQLHQIRKDIRSGKLRVEEAIDQIYNLCSKFPLAVQRDFKHIFKNW